LVTGNLHTLFYTPAAVFHVSTDFLLDIDKVKRLDISGLDENDIQIVSMMIDALRKKNHK